jgi:hypothetical protein
MSPSPIPRFETCPGSNAKLRSKEPEKRYPTFWQTLCYECHQKVRLNHKTFLPHMREAATYQPDLF